MASTDKSKQLSQPPAKQAMVSSDGTPTLPWSLFFQGLFNRVGGGYSDTVTDISVQVADLQARMTAIEGRVTTLEGEVATLQGQMTGVLQQLADQNARLNAVEAVIDAGWTGVVVTAALTIGGSQGALNFQSGVLMGVVPAS